jgi:hypothetical protein
MGQRGARSARLEIHAARPSGAGDNHFDKRSLKRIYLISTAKRLEDVHAQIFQRRQGKCKAHAGSSQRPGLTSSGGRQFLPRIIGKTGPGSKGGPPGAITFGC